MSAPNPPFKVRALYEYRSEHDDDLKFPEAQIITVTDIEDDDWYIGEYTDSAGNVQSGLFPNNFVEKYEPAPPPRPTRSRPRPAEAPTEPAPSESKPVPAPLPPPEPETALAEETPAVEAQQQTLPLEPRPQTQSAAVDDRDAVQSPPVAQSKPIAAPTISKKAPPPVAAKSNAFKDRIAAFNKPAAAPVAPFKPTSASSTFIKKPFVAPPPSRDAYVPPAREAAPPQKIYRRDEDPEIQERRVQDEEAARQAGLAGEPTAVDDGDEDAPKPIALKDRIAMLQKQQREQAERQATTTQKKEKPARPPQNRTISQEPKDDTVVNSEEPQITSQPEAILEDSPKAMPAPVQTRKASHAAQESEVFSDGGNDADQSAAGETTEDAAASDTSVEEESPVKRRHPAAPSQEPDVGDEEIDDDEDEDAGEEEMDEEQERQQRLRQRMAALSGAGRGGGMFNPMGFNPMAGMAGAPPAKKKVAAHAARDGEPPDAQPQSPPAPPVRMALPGLGGVRAAEAASNQPAPDEGDDGSNGAQGEEQPVTSARRASTGRPVPNVPQPAAAPPVPGSRPSLDSRPPAPAVPARDASEQGDGQSSEDDELDTVQKSPQAGGSSRASTFGAPPVPTRSIDSQEAPKSPPTRSLPPPVPTSPRVSMDRGPPPPIPQHGPPSQARAPPPPPPGSATAPQPPDVVLPSRPKFVGDDEEGGSEYEGDYDTDIASSARHKEALKSHMRNESLDDSTTADEASLRSPPAPRAVPPVPASAVRGAPPPPPQVDESIRRSVDGRRQSQDLPRAPPPLPPSRPSLDGDDYDPYRYSGSAPNRATRGPPPPAPSGGPPQLPPITSVDEEDDEALYSAPKRTSTDRSIPLSPTAISQPRSMRTVPPPPAQILPQPSLPQTTQSSSLAPARRSVEIDPASRRSVDQPRASHDGGYIARDIDLGQTSRWWSQPDSLPPALQSRRDIFFEIEDSSAAGRGGQTVVSKDVYVLFQDYSKTHITAQFDPSQMSEAQLRQEHGAPPDKLRQDQLEDNHTRFGSRLASMVAGREGSLVGDGSPQGLILDLLTQLPGALFPIGTRAYGALVYQNIGNATVAQYDEIRPGDIVSFRNARFQGKHGNLHTKYSLEVGKPDHVGVVAEWDGTKKKIRAWEQGKEDDGVEPEKGKSKKPGKVKVKGESYRLGDLRSGEVRVWRVMSRSWVGWNDDGA